MPSDKTDSPVATARLKSTLRHYTILAGSLAAGAAIEVHVVAHSKSGAMRAFVAKIERYKEPAGASNLTHRASFGPGNAVWFNLPAVSLDNVISGELVEHRSQLQRA